MNVFCLAGKRSVKEGEIYIVRVADAHEKANAITPFRATTNTYIDSKSVDIVLENEVTGVSQ